MALIENSKPRQDSGNYKRLFGNDELGALITKVQSTIISQGTELEKIVQNHAKNIVRDIDAFLEKPPQKGVYLLTKKGIKNSSLKSEKEPDFLIVKIDGIKDNCYIVELKEGNAFDTKKSAGEVASLKAFQNHAAPKLPMRSSIHVCMFYEDDKRRIVEGFKRRISEKEAMSGREFCEILEIGYEKILEQRLHHQRRNFDYFLHQISCIDEAREHLEKIICQHTTTDQKEQKDS